VLALVGQADQVRAMTEAPGLDEVLAEERKKLRA
jgi:hypothetical protein